MLWFSSLQPQYIGFEDVKHIIHTAAGFMINTLSNTDQKCLIQGTLSFDREETVINEWIEKSKMDVHIILYGKNSVDETVLKKRKQLLSLGFTKVYIYGGGLFEWLLLQDVYGCDEFPTTTPCSDLLKYRAPAILFARDLS